MPPAEFAQAAVGRGREREKGDSGGRCAEQQGAADVTSRHCRSRSAPCCVCLPRAQGEVHGEIDAKAEEHDDKDERQGVEAAHRERGPAERQQHARGEQGEDRGDRAPGSNAETQDGGEHEQRQRTGELYA